MSFSLFDIIVKLQKRKWIGFCSISIFFYFIFIFMINFRYFEYVNF